MKQQLSKELFWLCPIDEPNLIRLGAPMDGGYIVPQVALDNAQGLLSLGLGDDFTFDQDWNRIKPDDPIHMYDASVTGDTISIKVNRSARKDINIREQYRDFFQDKRQHYLEHISSTNFAAALDRIGVDRVFIKMDIEGGEYPLVDSIIQHNDRIVGISMEWHYCADRRDRWRETMARLDEYFAIVHVHGNNHVHRDRDGIFNCMETTYLRRNFISTARTRSEIYLPGLDHSNVVGAEDVEYYF
jgi:hypothetical protein